VISQRSSVFTSVFFVLVNNSVFYWSSLIAIEFSEFPNPFCARLILYTTSHTISCNFRLICYCYDVFYRCYFTFGFCDRKFVCIFSPLLSLHTATKYFFLIYWPILCYKEQKLWIYSLWILLSWFTLCWSRTFSSYFLCQTFLDFLLLKSSYVVWSARRFRILCAIRVRRLSRRCRKGRSLIKCYHFLTTVCS